MTGLVIDKKQDDDHAVYSASGSERWLSCAGSIALSLKAPPQKESEYAADGTKAHKCLEFLLKNRKRIDEALIMARQNYSREMIDHVMKAYNEILRRQPKHADLLSETKVDLAFIKDGMFGTVDAALVAEFDTLEVIDFKYGAGLVVDPEENSQLIYYALGLAHLYGYNFETVKLVIIQPRAEHEDGIVREWSTTIAYLKGWSQKFKDGVARCEDPKAEYTPGSHCRFCRAAPICPAISTRALAQAKIDFAPEKDQLVFPDPKQIQIPLLGPVLSAIEKLEFWIKEVKAHAFHAAERGEQIEGFKLVEKRSIRKWADPETAKFEADLAFGAKAFETSLLSPAQLEKAVGDKDWVTERTVSESSGLNLVPESHKSPAVDPLKKDFPEDKEETSVIDMTTMRKELDAKKRAKESTTKQSRKR